MTNHETHQVEIGERDRAILTSLWRWKSSTTAAIGEEFFGNPYSDAAYKRLRKMARHDHVRLLTLSADGRTIWVLGQRGFDQLRESLPELNQMRFQPQFVSHDYFTTVLQRGPWISECPPGTEIVSEQELLCIEPSRLPKWVPKSNLHRPDGYTMTVLTGEAAVIAFEVELHCKKYLDYERVARFYAATRSIYRVVWVTRTIADARWIQSIFAEATSEEYLIHDFLLLSDLRENCWESKIQLGHEAGQRLSYLLARGLSHPLLTGDTPSILDCRKRPYTSSIYGTARKRPISDSIAFSAISHSSTLNSPSDQDFSDSLPTNHICPGGGNP